MSQDLARVVGNVQKMVQQNASQDELAGYIAGEGMTPDQIYAETEKAGSGIGGITGMVVDAARGKRDPRFAGVPGFNAQGIKDLETVSAINRAKMITYDDAAYGDIVKNKLGQRLLNSEKDANGYEVLTYKDDDGKTQRTYLNAPGLDGQDIERGVVSSVPFMAAGGAAAVAAKGLGMVARPVIQAATAGVASLAADTAAQEMGSKQGHDLTRAGLAAAGAGIFEGLSPAAAAIWRRFVTQPAYVKNGALTEQGKAMATSMGLDPADIDGRLAKAIGRDLSVAADPAEVAAKSRMGEFEIVSTKGQRTKESGQLGTEEEMRRGLMGEQARTIMKSIDEDQAASIESAVFDKVGNRIAPNAPGREVATLGQDIRTGANTAKANLDDAEAKFWEQAGPMFPREDGLALLAPRISKSLQDSNIWPKPNLGAFENSNAMLQMLDDYKNGKVALQELPLIGKGKSSIFLDDMRRYLLNLYSGAERGSADEKAARAIYNGFNGWIDDLADNALLVGKPEVAARLKAARGFTKEMKELFEPGGATSPAAKKIATVMDEASSPEEAVRALFGAGAPTSEIQRGQIQALAHMKRIMLDHGEAGSWDSIRMAFWSKLAVDRKGEVLSAKNLMNNIDAAFHNQQSVMNVLYSKEEQAMMKRLSTALEDATFTPPNTSGTSYEAERLRRKYDGDSVIKTFLQTQSKRELFSKHNVLMSRIYSVLAKKMPVSVLSSKEGAGAKLAERATSQEVTRAAPLSLGNLGAAAGAQYDE
jgi:hypothetical protein